MKIILLKDVQKVGRKFDIKDVSDGFAQNMLIPRGLAVLASPATIQKINLEKEKSATEEKIQGELLLKSLEKIKGLTITIYGKANEKGHLFAGINKEMLLSEIYKQAHLNLDPESLILEKHIKEVGEHKVTVQAGGKKVEMNVVIVAE